MENISKITQKAKSPEVTYLDTQNEKSDFWKVLNARRMRTHFLHDDFARICKIGEIEVSSSSFW